MIDWLRILTISTFTMWTVGSFAQTCDSLFAFSTAAVSQRSLSAEVRDLVQLHLDIQSGSMASESLARREFERAYNIHLQRYGQAFRQEFEKTLQQLAKTSVEEEIENRKEQNRIVSEMRKELDRWQHLDLLIPSEIRGDFFNDSMIYRHGDGYFAIHDFKQDKEIYRFEHKELTWHAKVALSPDRQTVWILAGRKLFELNLATGKTTDSSVASDVTWDEVHISSDGQTLYAVGSSGYASIDLTRKFKSANFKRTENLTSSVQTKIVESGDGRFVVLNLVNRKVAVFDRQTGKDGLVSGPWDINGAGHQPNSIEFLPDGKSLVYVSEDGHLGVVNVESGKGRVIATFVDNQFPLVTSPDGQWLYSWRSISQNLPADLIRINLETGQVEPLEVDFHGLKAGLNNWIYDPHQNMMVGFEFIRKRGSAKGQMRVHWLDLNTHVDHVMNEIEAFPFPVNRALWAPDYQSILIRAPQGLLIYR